MGCGASTPKVKQDYGGTTSAASHRAARTKPGDQVRRRRLWAGLQLVQASAGPTQSL